MDAAEAPAISQAELTTVLDEENLPYSSENGNWPGLNTELTRALADKMNRPLKIEWDDTLNEGLVSPLLREKNPTHLAVGIPVEPKMVEDEQRVGDKIHYSKAYASTRYVLVTRKSHDNLDAFQDMGTAKVGVEMSSVASRILWNYGFLVERLESQDHILRATLKGDLEYGVLWSNAGWLILSNDDFRDELRVQSTTTVLPGLAWNLAVAVGPSSRHLLPQIDKAINELQEEGVITDLFAKYATPYFEPFTQEGKTTP